MRLAATIPVYVNLKWKNTLTNKKKHNNFYTREFNIIACHYLLLFIRTEHKAHKLWTFF